MPTRKKARQDNTEESPAALPKIAAPNIGNLAACVEDSRLAGLDGSPGPADPVQYQQLLGRLIAVRAKLPPIYREEVFDPYFQVLRNIGETGFVDALVGDPTRQRAAGLMLDIAHAILQNGEGFLSTETDAFQEVISDLYDGFLSAEDRRGVAPPDLGVLAPLVKWGNPESGPYTWAGSATGEVFGVGAAIVSLPPANALRGVMAWAALGHETAGHDILGADTGLTSELVLTVRDALEDAGIGSGLPQYWSSRIDETASDVLGILNMGPAAGIGLIAFFRGLSAAAGAPPKLRNNGPANDSHPADILRGFLAAETIRLLDFEGAEAWAKIVEDETRADLGVIRAAGRVIDVPTAVESARIVARAIVLTPLESLENHALGEIQNWRDTDEEKVAQLRALFGTVGVVNSEDQFYAAHVVAAAVVESLSGRSPLSLVFQRMIAILKNMHNENPSWGPLFVLHPGDLTRHRAYLPQS